jgi:hypothetical protein
LKERLRTAAPALAGLALLALFIAPLLDPGQQLYYRDTGRLYYPVKLYIAQQLRLGHLPLWNPLTEAGVSILGQMTPGLLHPATLLYLTLPFDFAFKLNHALGLFLGGAGAYRLARRLGASKWAAMASAVAYGGCGYLVSIANSNLPFALGAGSVPLAVDAVLGFVEAPRARRLAWAGAMLGSIALAGEPQSMLIAGVIACAWVMLQGRSVRAVANSAGKIAACGALALCVSAPAVLPAYAHLRRSERAEPLNQKDRASFANHPLRLAGLLVPRAFDELPQDRATARTTFAEYFAVDSASFADSIVLGAPALLLAFAGAFARRRGRVLLLGAVFFALASTGEALKIDVVLYALVPMARMFRFAEKLTAPACLLFALATAIGADAALAGPRRAARRLAFGSAAAAALCAAGGAWITAQPEAAASTIAALGKTHGHAVALQESVVLRAGLFEAALLSLALAAAAGLRAARERNLVGLASLCCVASVFTSSSGLLYSAPVEYVRGPFDLANALEGIAGPSPGRWRLFVNESDNTPTLSELPQRIAITFGIAEALMPQFNATAGIEAVGSYFSAGDPAYKRAFRSSPEKFFDLYGVRFVVQMPWDFTPAMARHLGFHRFGPFDYWMRESPVGPRAFVVGRASRVETVDEAARRIESGTFLIRKEAVIRGDAAPASIEGAGAAATLERISPERIHVNAQGPGLLVVGEHFDPGWRASSEGRSLPVLEADLAAIGVPFGSGSHEIDLRFVPKGFHVGLALLACAALALTILVTAETIRVRRARSADFNPAE